MTWVELRYKYSGSTLLIRCELLGPGFVFKPKRYETLTKSNQYVYSFSENTGKEGKW